MYRHVFLPSFVERRFPARIVLLPVGFPHLLDFLASFSWMESPVVVVAALAERRAFALSSACPVGTVEASFPPSNHALQRTTGPLLRFLGLGFTHSFLSAQRHCRQWSLSFGSASFPTRMGRTLFRCRVVSVAWSFASIRCARSRRVSTCASPNLRLHPDDAEAEPCAPENAAIASGLQSERSLGGVSELGVVGGRSLHAGHDGRRFVPSGVHPAMERVKTF